MSTPVPTKDPRIVALPAAEIRRRFVEFFAERGHTVVPSASLVPAGDATLLFTNSGMVQFKDVLIGAETRSYKRAVDYQRCLRVAGKHNDFEEVGRTPRHHTFFEMLGNWSFGDYFKRDAILFAWDFLTRDLGIPGDRLAATTYKDDEVARQVWREEIGLPPERMAIWGDVDAGDDNNFWRMAETGPCGPCSEIHFDRGAHLSEGPHCIPDHSETCPRWLEIWNLVFMEFDQKPDGRVPLPFPSVDTGLGLERLASVLQQVPTNYDTDLFTPIHARMRELLGHDPDAFESERFSYQVIADHSRAVTFLIADDVLPSNEGRGYVLRKLFRRAVRHGRLLGRREPFMAETAAVVIDVMGEAYPARGHPARGDPRRRSLVRRPNSGGRSTPGRSCSNRRSRSSASISAARAVGRRPEELPADAPRLPGDIAFRLHDTYGFPIDLTVEVAAEYGVAIDRDGFERALAEQRERSRSGTKAQLSRHAEQSALYGAIQGRGGDTRFVGYETTTAEGRVVAIVRDGMEFDELTGHGEAEVVLDRTPFYAEGGGQVGDQGVLREPGGGSELFTVTDTQKPLGGLVVHRGTLRGRLRVGETVEAVVDAARRADTMRNHTGTHLLHRALRNVVGERARQAGSLVTPGLPALRLPVRPRPDRRGAARDRGRGPPHHPRRPARQRGVHDDGGGDRGRRGRLLRREVRRDGPDGPRPGLQLRAVRRHALPGQRPDRRLPDHLRAEHRLGDAPHRGGHRPGGRRPRARALRCARTRGRGRRRPVDRRRRRPRRDPPGRAARDQETAQGRRRGRRSPSPGTWPRARSRSCRGCGWSPRPCRRPRWMRSRRRRAT